MSVRRESEDLLVARPPRLFRPLLSLSFLVAVFAAGGLGWAIKAAIEDEEFNAAILPMGMLPKGAFQVLCNVAEPGEPDLLAAKKAKRNPPPGMKLHCFSRLGDGREVTIYKPIEDE